MVAGLLRPDSGQILWSNRPLKPSLSQSRISFMPEERGIYQDQRVVDVMTYWAALRGLSKRGAAHAVEHWLHRLALSEKTSAPVRSLSKGNQQKIQLAACLLHAPDLIVFDEPFSGLDPINQDLVCAILQEQARRGSVVLVSAHQLALVERIAHRTVILAKGRVLQDEVRSLAVGAKGKKWLVSVAASDRKSAAEIIESIGGIVLSHASDSLVRAVFEITRAESFFEQLADIARHPCVLDVEVEKADLHQTYVSLMSEMQ